LMPIRPHSPGPGRRHPHNPSGRVSPWVVATVSTTEAPGARRGRSRSPLGSCQGCFEVGSDLGHDLFGAADPRLPATFAAGAALAALGSGRGSDGDLVPRDLLVDGDAHESPPIGR
jgi:hypothetical protein